MMTFKKEHSHFATLKAMPSETITVTTTEEGLLEVISAFERFLMGCGYALDGHLEFIYDDEDVPATDDGAGNEDEGVRGSKVLSWVHDPDAPSIYEDGYESPSNGAQSDWPFPVGNKP